ncbi:ABC transporter ATP-binding protein [Bradyrhizobium sp. LHD-71]|uniref:ABC transporter ATP-binding protein n=1 Tax=Bradyrhizobium sp. LHD-71 TaxID=3072141 RepID=UPI00280F4E42|nr:ABC transporter ATP-binding protein [Bradyrhizobium sp. LHD-71]MDQ8727221.1 ABC transporter ATP-binding protein [Bradyrhizobium sp. LHD-71]
MKDNVTAPAIEVEDLSIHYGTVSAVSGVSFSVNQGEQLTLLGPSGCGKTSTLRAVAGLERPSGGAIRIGGRTMYDGAKRINVPTEQRGLSMVFQSYAIWPHMTVFDNVAYGLRVRNEGAAGLKEKVHHALDLVKMGAFASRNASLLSGGQQQRVALARACAFSPSVLLFDEPLSNLDAKLRAEMRIELRELQRRLKVTSLYVTHDLEEALAMSDRIAVMRSGNIEQSGTPNEIYNFPRTAFVADFIGSANLINGRLMPERSVDGRIAVEVDGGNILLGVSHGRSPGPQPTLSLRTVHLRLSAEPPAVPENVWPVRVKRSVFLGDLTQVHVEWSGRELVIRQTTAAPRGEGEKAYLSIDPRHCVLLEAD